MHENRLAPLTAVPSSPGIASVLFTEVVARWWGGSAGRCSENPKMAVAAVRALAMPNGGGGIGNSSGGEGATRRQQGRGEGERGGGRMMGRGGGRSTMKSSGRGGAGGGDTVVAAALRFAQDLLAQLAAVVG